MGQDCIHWSDSLILYSHEMLDGMKDNYVRKMEGDGVMKRFSKPKALLTIFLLFVFLTMTGLFGIAPTATMASVIDLLKPPDSTPGGLTVTWYTAKRFNSEVGLGGLLNNVFYGQVDQAKSEAAYKSFDRSVIMETESISDLTFDMTRWVETDKWKASLDAHDTWVWGEVTGYIKVPKDGFIYFAPTRGSTANYTLEIDGVMQINAWYLVPSTSSEDNWRDYGLDAYQDYKGEYKSFRLRIGCPKIDTNQSYPNTQFSLRYNVMNFYRYYDGAPPKTLPAEYLYSKLTLKDMQKFFKFDPANFTLTLDPVHSSFNVQNYENGVFTGDNTSDTGFQPLKFGTNNIAPDSGDVIVRDKTFHNLYITVGNISLTTEDNLKVTRRTPTTAELSWSAPDDTDKPTGYDIYRKIVDGIGGFSYMGTVKHELVPYKVGSASGLTFTDSGLEYSYVYEYFVKAQYASGFSPTSNIAKTDAVPMEGLPSIPSNIKIDYHSQTDKTALALSWPASYAESGIKEYIVYRKRTSPPPVQEESSSGKVIIGSLIELYPQEIGRTTTTSYIDGGLNLYDECEYHIQAVDNNGIPSLMSSAVKFYIEDVAPPSRPDKFFVGEVLRQGDNVQYVYPEETGIRNVVLGPERDIALSWEPSTDNVGVVGYNIYRVASGTDYSTKDIFWGEKEHLIGSTEETFFMDKGLEFGATYTYYVEAKDTVGNVSRNWDIIGTKKSTLSDLKITNGSQSLTPDPAFVYYQAEYSLDVENAVRSITLMPKKIDYQAKVLVNGVEAEGSRIGPLSLEPGVNTFVIEVVPRPDINWYIGPETMRYTLTVNRANVNNLPALTLPESGTVLNEGSTYQAVGKIDIQEDRVWAGTADYGDGTGEQSLQLNADGSFSLEHCYQDNERYKINAAFRYKDLGLVTGSLEVSVENVAPALTGEGLKDEITTSEGALLTIAGSIADPGQDSWTVTGDYGSPSGPTAGEVKEDKTFIFKETFYDQKPLYDLVVKVLDDDGGAWSKSIKIKVENVAPSIKVGEKALAQRGIAFTRAGVFTDPGQDNWQATVDYGDGSSQQPLSLRGDKSFDLDHVYLKAGSFIVTVRVEDQDGGVGSASFPVKVKNYVFTFETGENLSIKEGEKLERSIPVQGWPDKIKSITVDYGDGTGAESVALSTNYPGAQSGITDPAGIQPMKLVREDQESVVSAKTMLPQAGWLQLRHIYTDNGTYTVKVKIIDADGDIYEDSFQVEAANVPPTVQLESIEDMYVGNTFTCRGNITDPGTDTWTVEIDYNDGSGPHKISVDSDKTFSFSRSYSKSDYYLIEAVVQDDDGGIGLGSQQVRVRRHHHVTKTEDPGEPELSNDASLHTLEFIGGLPILQQNDGAYKGTGFTSDCLHYTIPGSMMLLQIEVTADDGATIRYTNGENINVDLPQDTPTMVDMLSPLTIIVTAADGVTTREYTVEVE